MGLYLRPKRFWSGNHCLLVELTIVLEWGVPLPKEIVTMLARGDLDLVELPNSDYTHMLPTLGSDVFPDKTRIWDIHESGTKEGKKLHGALKQAGLTKGQRAGVTHLLSSFLKVGENDLTAGDIRALTEEELKKLRGRFFGGASPSITSINKVKKLFG